ncbi:MAG: hypothetical protein D6730_23080 [Bacteroidetes bacterium]|nr:MAG: hypothetical protein D6730_23080 [Bacteroidota bacterium]
MMKIFTLVLVLFFLLIACTHTNEDSEQDQPTLYSQPSFLAIPMDTISVLSPDQQSALDALNTLQVSTDEKNRLYSTFAGIVQPAYPPDTMLTISQSELLAAMKVFVSMYCKNLPVEERNKLAATAVLAQTEYRVLVCTDKSAHAGYEHGIPMTGTWVLPGVLGRRDVIIVW